MGTRVRNVSAIVLICLFCLSAAIQVEAADRMFFSGISSLNSNTGQRDVILVWGELEGTVPPEIQKFNIYRKTGTAPYASIHSGIPIANKLMTPDKIKDLFNEPGEGKQRQEIIAMLSEAVPGTDGSNFHTALHNIMDPASPEYNPLQRQFLIRYSRDTARAAGRAFIDRSVALAVSYTYMITGSLSNGTETPPLGRFTIDTTAETILPAANNFEQVRIGGCSESRKNIDHARIHLNWEVPSTPDVLSVRSLIYGYDIYRATADLGPLNLRIAVPSTLVRINDVPIIASGNAASEGLDAFLSKDDGNALTGGVGLTPGDIYYYYLVARDLSGNYSKTAGPLKAVVPDTRAPVVPWNVHGQKEEVGSAPFTPRLTLLWDQVNSTNYLKHYGTGKQICDSSPIEVCYVQPPDTCNIQTPLCVDLDVVKYLVYRFDSFKAATEWGTDSDGDIWPDELEDLNGNGSLDPGETDPCDAASHPAGYPAKLVAQILQEDPSYIRTLASGKKTMAYQDPVPAPDNKVYWYRISTLDPSGNQSPLSPPARAALWDRSQPDINGTIRGQECDYTAKYYPPKEGRCDKPCTGEGDVLTLIDETNLATGFKLYEVCVREDKTPYNRLIYSGSINGRRCLKRGDEINSKLCLPQCSQPGKYKVTFFGRSGFGAESDPFELPGGLCEPSGCVVLFKECRGVEISIHKPGYMPPVLPGDPLQVCAELSPGECATVYQEVQGNYSPVLNFCNPNASKMTLCDMVDLQGIVTMDACLGLRIFSKNHVGSGMGYFQCIPVLANPPQPPLLSSVKKSGTDSDPTFELRWSAQSEGISAFIVQQKGESSTVYETVWDLDPEKETGQFVYELPIQQDQIEEKWCFKVKAVDKAFQMSSWSSGLCEIWGEKKGTKYLKWPHVSEPADGGTLTAFYLKNEQVGAIALSGDLTPVLDKISRSTQCDYNILECTAKGEEGNQCLSALMACNCSLCGYMDSWNDFGQFVVYRQEADKEYVQVSPLVEKIHCEVIDTPISDNCTWLSAISDPMIYLAKLSAGAIGGIPDTSQLAGTTRLIFVDWYPHKAGSTVRYHLMKMRTADKEPETIYTSDWIQMK